MTASASERNTPRKLSGYDLVHNFECTSGVVILKGTICTTTAGKATPGTSATGQVCVGRAMDTVSPAAATGSRINVEQGIFRYESATGAGTIAQDDIGKLCYIDDNQTVSVVATSKSVAGTVVDVDALGVWVMMGFNAGVPGPTGPTGPTGP